MLTKSYLFIHSKTKTSSFFQLGLCHREYSFSSSLKFGRHELLRDICVSSAVKLSVDVRQIAHGHFNSALTLAGLA